MVLLNILSPGLSYENVIFQNLHVAAINLQTWPWLRKGDRARKTEFLLKTSKLTVKVISVDSCVTCLGKLWYFYAHFKSPMKVFGSSSPPRNVHHVMPSALPLSENFCVHSLEWFACQWPLKLKQESEIVWINIFNIICNTTEQRWSIGQLL
jgi:hypothetical protein